MNVGLQIMKFLTSLAIWLAVITLTSKSKYKGIGIGLGLDWMEKAVLSGRPAGLPLLIAFIFINSSLSYTQRVRSKTCREDDKKSGQQKLLSFLHLINLSVSSNFIIVCDFFSYNSSNQNKNIKKALSIFSFVKLMSKMQQHCYY